MKPIHYGALLLLGAIWGASFLFIGVAVDEFGPTVLMFLRVLIAGLIMLPLAALTRRKNNGDATLRWRTHWPKVLILGLFNAALPYTLIAFSELQLTASLAAILNSTTPLFTVLIAAAWGQEALTGRKLGGVVLGILGVSVLMGSGALALTTDVLIAMLASLLAALCYGLATVYAAEYFGGFSAMDTSIAQYFSAVIWLAIPASLAIPPAMPSPGAILALLTLALLSTAFAYLLYFFLLKNVGSTRTASVTLLVPVFGSLWGILFLQEPFNTGMLLGLAIILASVGLVTGVQLRGKQRQAAVQPPGS